MKAFVDAWRLSARTLKIVGASKGLLLCIVRGAHIMCVVMRERVSVERLCRRAFNVLTLPSHSLSQKSSITMSKHCPIVLHITICSRVHGKGFP